MRSKTLLLLLACLPLNTVLADDPVDLSAERPGFSTPSAPVGLGVLQLEQGFTYEWAQLGNVKFRTISVPQAVVRFGITKDFELRFSTTGYTWQETRSALGNNVVTGANDFVIGAKYRFLKQSEGGFRPELSVIGGLSIPAKGSAFTSGGYDPYFTLAADKDLPHKFSVIANANFASVTDPLGRNYQTGEGFWVTRPYKYVSPFVEMFHTTIGRDLGSEVVADGGLYRGIGKHVQIDVEAGHTVAGMRPSLYASVGLVIRTPEPLIGPDRFHFHKQN